MDSVNAFMHKSSARRKYVPACSLHALPQHGCHEPWNSCRRHSRTRCTRCWPYVHTHVFLRYKRRAGIHDKGKNVIAGPGSKSRTSRRTNMGKGSLHARKENWRQKIEHELEEVAHHEPGAEDGRDNTRDQAEPLGGLPTRLTFRTGERDWSVPGAASSSPDLYSGMAWSKPGQTVTGLLSSSAFPALSSTQEVDDSSQASTQSVLGATSSSPHDVAPAADEPSAEAAMRAGTPAVGSDGQAVAPPVPAPAQGAALSPPVTPDLARDGPRQARDVVADGFVRGAAADALHSALTPDKLAAPPEPQPGAAMLNHVAAAFVMQALFPDGVGAAALARECNLCMDDDDDDFGPFSGMDPQVMVATFLASDLSSLATRPGRMQPAGSSEPATGRNSSMPPVTPGTARALSSDRTELASLVAETAGICASPMPEPSLRKRATSPMSGTPEPPSPPMRATPSPVIAPLELASGDGMPEFDLQPSNEHGLSIATPRTELRTDSMDACDVSGLLHTPMASSQTGPESSLYSSGEDSWTWRPAPVFWEELASQAAPRWVWDLLEQHDSSSPRAMLIAAAYQQLPASRLWLAKALAEVSADHCEAFLRDLRRRREAGSWSAGFEAVRASQRGYRRIIGPVENGGILALLLYELAQISVADAKSMPADASAQYTHWITAQLELLARVLVHLARTRPVLDDHLSSLVQALACIVSARPHVGVVLLQRFLAAWPVRDGAREVSWLRLVATVLVHTPAPLLSGSAVCKSLFRRIVAAIQSPHALVARSALELAGNMYVLLHYVLNEPAVMSAVSDALQANQDHWCAEVRQLSEVQLDALLDLT